MIAGLGGELISHAYLEERVLPGIDRAQMAGFERRLLRWWRQVSRELGPASSSRAVHDVAVVPLMQMLGHRVAAGTPERGGISSRMDASHAIVLSVPWSVSPRASWRDAVVRGSKGQVPWALICNGRSLRIVDCSRAWSRSGIEFDFASLTLSAAGVAALALLAAATSLTARDASSLRAHIHASDAHAVRVCRVLSDGVLDALPKLTAALARRRSDYASAFDQALTVVYRILFLLFAEARSLVPVWHDIYRDAYTIDALARRAVTSKTAGLWEALQAIARLAHAGCDAGDLSVTAFNGRLFSPSHAPLVDRGRVPDALMADILLGLTTDSTGHARRRISYHDLGVEQLGSVYERVLEHEPQGHTAGVTLSRTSVRRKSSGSFYTPQTLTDYLVRRTLAPLIAGKTSEEILQLRIVDPAMGSGAFLVAACGYLAECCEAALVRDGERLDSHQAARAELRRLIAERCLYGVDINPTAVQVGRLSLWLTTLAGDRPLTFLDHHLAAGNSLIGAWLSDLSMPPRPAVKRLRQVLPLFDEAIADDLSHRVIPARLRLALEPSDSLDAVKRKERSLAELAGTNGPLARWTAAAHAWCGAALWPGSPPSSALVSEWIASATGSATSLTSAQLQDTFSRAIAHATSHSCFHWELAFPEIFFDTSGRPLEAPGFDAVIGNPPWDVMRADTGTTAEREHNRAATAAALRFFRASRRYRHQGTGHPNRYQLFVERALQLTKPHGRIGLLLPSGIATDHGSAALRRNLLERTTIDTWLGFDNRRRIFPIHRSTRFVVLTTTNAGETPSLRYLCGLTDAAVLHRSELLVHAPSISRDRIASLSPDRFAVPEVTDRMALAILIGIADRVPALGSASGWNVRFGRELNATDDRPHFVTRVDAPGMLPIVEGKQLSPFQVDVARSTFAVPVHAAASLIDRRTSFDRDRIAYRDVASATNKLTLIAALLPAGTISTHTVFCAKTPLDERSQWALLGLLNSLIANYLVRLNVTTHVTTGIMSQLRVPKPELPQLEPLATLARAMARTGLADADGYARLNSIAARLYGISAEEYAFILESFPLLPTSLRQACLSAYSNNNTHRITESRNH
jgi:hypothetical protein